MPALARAYWNDVREGMAWLWSRPVLRSVTLALAAVNFPFTPVFVLLPVYVRDVLQRGPQWYGFLLSAAGGGAIAGAALASWALTGRTGVTRALVGIGACTAALGANRSALQALVLLFALGLLSGILNVRVMTTLQASTPSELRGRILGVTVALAGAAVPAGLGLGGVIGGLPRPGPAWVIFDCGVAIVAVAAVLRPRWSDANGT